MSFPLVSYAVQSKGPVLSGLMVDNGVALLASNLIQAGYTPRIFDYSNIDTIERIAKVGKEQFVQEVIQELDSYIKTNDVKIVGFKLYANGFRDSVNIAGHLKEKNPRIMSVAGGPQVTTYRHDVFGEIDIKGGTVRGSDIFDALVYADGDLAIVGLADVAYKGENISNVPNLLLPDGSWTVRKDVDLDQLPFPNYDKDVYPGLENKIFIPVVEDSRGCPHVCTFCIHPIIGGRLRERSIERIIEEMEYTKKKYGARVFRLSGPSPTAERINELSTQLPEGYKISAFGYSSPEYDFTGEVPNKVLGIFVGLESTDKRILEEVYRKTKDAHAFLENVEKMVQDFKEAGLATIVSMIIPSPDETQETIDKSVEYILRLRPDFVPANPLGLMFGTPIARMAEQQGERIGAMVDPNYLSELMKLEFDLLQPPQNWPTLPYKLRVNGKLTRDVFSITYQFLRRLAEEGISPNSDEIVLMSYLHNGGLSANQDDRRKEVNGFMATARQYITTGNTERLREMVNTINRNQVELGS